MPPASGVRSLGPARPPPPPRRAHTHPPCEHPRRVPLSSQAGRFSFSPGDSLSIGERGAAFYFFFFLNDNFPPFFVAKTHPGLSRREGRKLCGEREGKIISLGLRRSHLSSVCGRSREGGRATRAGGAERRPPIHHCPHLPRGTQLCRREGGLPAGLREQGEPQAGLDPALPSQVDRPASQASVSPLRNRARSSLLLHPCPAPPAHTEVTDADRLHSPGDERRDTGGAGLTAAEAEKACRVWNQSGLRSQRRPWRAGANHSPVQPQFPPLCTRANDPLVSSDSFLEDKVRIACGTSGTHIVTAPN